MVTTYNLQPRNADAYRPISFSYDDETGEFSGPDAAAPREAARVLASSAAVFGPMPSSIPLPEGADKNLAWVGYQLNSTWHASEMFEGSDIFDYMEQQLNRYVDPEDIETGADDAKLPRVEVDY